MHCRLVHRTPTSLTVPLPQLPACCIKATISPRFPALTSLRRTPQVVAGLEGVELSAVAAGEHVSACTTADGSAFFWGMASTGVLPKGPVPDDEDEHADDVVPKKMNRTKVGRK